MRDHFFKQILNTLPHFSVKLFVYNDFGRNIEDVKYHNI